MKLRVSLLIVSLSSIIFFACKPPQLDEKQTLSVSIEPQKYLLEAIIGDKYTINTVIPSGSNPESYDPSPSQMVSIGKSKVYFKIGELGFENTWLQNIKGNNPDMKIVDCSIGLKQITDHEHHGHAGNDPHIWSSPKTALTVAKNIYNGIIEFDKENQEYYLKNYTKLESTINKTDSITKAYIAEAPSKTFVIFHPALSYFAEEYGLTQLTIEVDGKSPTPQQLSKLIQQAKKDKVVVVFIQEEFDEKNAEIVAKEIGAKIVRINPLSYNWEEEMIKIAKAIAQRNE
jgi:zinc transport system substrate-binding protein